MSEQFTILVGDDGWRIGAAGDDDVRICPADPGDDTPARAQAARQALDEQGWTGQPVTLALASPWCLSAVISTEQLERTNRRRAMGYRFEEHLPVSAEDVVADYVARGDEALGVCAELARLAPVVAELEACGVGVAHIVPAALLAAASAAREVASADGVLLCGESGIDLVELDRGRPARWWWFADDADALADRVVARGWAELVVAGAGEQLRTRLAEVEGLPLGDTPSADPDALACCESAELLEAGRSPWIDLRRDGLAAPARQQALRRPLVALATAAAVLLLCVAGIAIWRGQQYGQLTDEFTRRQADEYRKVFDVRANAPVPTNMKRRLASERRRLALQAGQGAGDSDAVSAESRSALGQLAEILANLPGDLRFRILDLSIDPDMIRVDGQARSHAEAERVALALRQSGGYDVDPPKTTRLTRERGVSFVFTARPLVAPGRAMAGGER